MKLLLMRTDGTEGYTAGRLLIEGLHVCDCLEDEVRAVKLQGMTAIPAGTYQIIITMSPRFKKRLPLLLNVPGCSGIRIHSGSSALDTAGCILVGSRPDDENGVLENSWAAMHDLQTKIQSAIDANDEVWITIMNCDHIEGILNMV